MKIQVNTDHRIPGHETLATSIRSTVDQALRRSSDQITRVDVHVSDENGDGRGPNDTRCVMEARLEGLEPVAVTCKAATVHQAVDGAAGELARAVGRTLQRLHDRRLQRTDPLPPAPNEEP